ncbi:spermidine/putrescine ABC transporter permease PotB [Pasteurella multocida]|uniref:spermidine/putrescine ABC transporter permease PotB n=1 Tax=Pasteurella multocida TaxID=747 RepID=UPI0009A0BA55|nr:spermidine/putrescine ABC transporter permease PotB [Pasteurella multocida]NNI34863.1 spermidine/putrescine ABC transporter permease PotB [Pasteurella multocida]OPD01270.1 spermidine/putrescine ABC transporter permease PotB [Pasteurella multocida subsp. multocida]URJ98689.1 spermidine/putrescine ABC transporter permease PotB [Pasteurella multocida]UZJ29069.1 spermidine/putrescine ABC transporter permease PotB [Pasteurella multocida]UZJ36285.1 spermidine/putrescine ABC transporter permease P
MKNNAFQKSTIGVIFGWLIFFVLAPNLLVLIVSFLTRDSSNFYALPFTLENYTRLFEPLYAQVVWNSLYMSGLATLVCLIIGYPFAFLLTKINPKYRPFLLFLVVLPFWTNSLIRIYGMKIFLGVKGILNSTLMSIGLIDTPIRILNTEVAVIIGLVYLLLPFMILPLYASIEKLDYRLLEAAKDLGANAFQRFIKVIIPLTMPGIIAACLLVLLPAMGMFYVADLLGGAKVLLVGNVIKSEFLISRNWPFGSAISIGLTILMALLIFVYYKASKLMNKKMELE